MVTVTGLAYYPIKGCAAVPVDSFDVRYAGPRHDRSFMIVDADGVFRTQRGMPGLSVIRPEIRGCGEQLVLHAAGAAPLVVDVRTNAPLRVVQHFGNPMRAIDQGDDAARWLTEVLGDPSRLVRVPQDHTRVVRGYVDGTSGFADSGALTLLAQTSMALLDSHITSGGGESVSIDRFRGNVLIDGWPEPHTEDRVRALTIGTVRFAFLKFDIRCSVTLVDQQRGVRSGPEPLKALARYRRTEPSGVAFGVKLTVLEEGVIGVGDDVVVDEWESVG